MNLSHYSKSDFSNSEIGSLAVWILTGWKSRYSSIISVILMGSIIFFNVEYFDVLFRNVAIAFGGLALLIMDTKKWPSWAKNRKLH